MCMRIQGSQNRVTNSKGAHKIDRDAYWGDYHLEGLPKADENLRVPYTEVGWLYIIEHYSYLQTTKLMLYTLASPVWGRDLY